MPRCLRLTARLLIPTHARVTAIPGKPDVANAAAVTEAIETRGARLP